MVHNPSNPLNPKPSETLTFFVNPLSRNRVSVTITRGYMVTTFVNQLTNIVNKPQLPIFTRGSEIVFYNNYNGLHGYDILKIVETVGMKLVYTKVMVHKTKKNPKRNGHIFYLPYPYRYCPSQIPNGSPRSFWAVVVNGFNPILPNIPETPMSMFLGYTVINGRVKLVNPVTPSGVVI